MARLVGPGDAYRSYLERRLFGPVGMTSADPGFDTAGTWVASSTVHATAHDYAPFGYLYLRDGVWEGRRLLPEGWVDHGRLPRSVDPENGDLHGAHWWVVGDDRGASGLRATRGSRPLSRPARTWSSSGWARSRRSGGRLLED